MELKYAAPQWLAVAPDGSLWDGPTCVGVYPELCRVAAAMLRNVALETGEAIELKLCLRLPVSAPGPWQISWVDLMSGEEGTTDHPTGERDHVERTAARLNQVQPGRLHWAINRAR